MAITQIPIGNIGGTSATPVSESNKMTDNADTRLSDARTPTAHVSTHATGGSDPMAPSDIGAATAAQGALADSALQPSGDGSGLSGITASQVGAVATSGAETIAGVKTFSSPPNLSSLTASKALVIDASNNVASSSATATELGYVAGVTSGIQSQINDKAPLASPELTGTPTVPTAPVSTNTDQAASTAFVMAEQALDLKASNNLSDVGNKVTARSNLYLNYPQAISILPDSGRFSIASPTTNVYLPSTPYTASTLSIDSATATVTSSTSSFSTSTFASGTLITMHGWTNTANNSIQVRVASISTSSMVLVGPGIENIVTEIEGASITITAHPLSNTSNLFNTRYSTSWWAGKFIWGNTTNGGSAGAIAPCVESHLTAMGRTAGTASARYGVEFGYIGFTANAGDPAIYRQMTINDGGAYFGGVGNYLTKGYWLQVKSGAAKIISSGSLSIDGSEYELSTEHIITDSNWHCYLAIRANDAGYVKSTMEVSGLPGTEVIMALPVAFPGVLAPEFSWTSPLINYHV